MKVLILDEDYHQYQSLLRAANVAADAALDPAEFSGAYDVLLAQPDLAAQYLQLGGEASWIQSTWAGVDALVNEARSSGVVVTGLKSVFGPQMAEYVFGFLLSQARSLAYFREQQDAGCWAPRPPQMLAGRSLSILGTGTIGAHVAGIAKSFAMETRGVSRSGHRVENFDTVGPTGKIVQVVSGTDVLINTLPGTEQTRGIIDAELLGSLSPNATLFNLGRGSALCEDGLHSWLDANECASAVLDVFAVEPLPRDHWLWRHPQVSITPHISAVSFPVDVVQLFLTNLRRWKLDEPLEHVIDLERGY